MVEVCLYNNKLAVNTRFVGCLQDDTHKEGREIVFFI